MWQRIQTLWLLLSVIAMGVFSFMDLLVLTPQGKLPITLSPWSISDVSVIQSNSPWGVGLLAVISIVLSIVAILMFRNRRLQRRITTLNILILIGLLIYIGIIVYQLTSASGIDWGVKFALSLPLVSIILLYLALRGIIRDDILVRMSDRLR